jgi:ferredoxin
MAMKISDECISCGACQPECPVEAIYEGGVGYEVDGKKGEALSQDHFYIAPEKCTDCGACASVCPTDSIQK